MNHAFKAGLAVTACLFASIATAQSTNSFPQMPVDAKTLRIFNQAEEVYERTDYERAFFIYRNELAPIGDKYGQYMVGFMYLTGKGVDEDRVAASAWYRLAAERGTKEFIRARDQVLRSLNGEQRAESDQLFMELRREYGDLVLLARAIREDYQELKSRTGSRVSAGSSPVTVLDMRRSGSTTSGSEYYGRIERRLEARLDYIAQHTEIDIVDLDADSLDIDEFEQQVENYLGRLD
ncbi:MAG: hypothetical protein QNJ23_04580 [Woeseiaceae bacterium]|nr:hypothetical protein [Woeseiaceae bacterium]